MSKKLICKFESPEVLFEKLRRDKERLLKALKSENETDLCDNFFDYCVTAHSLRAWVIKDNSCRFSKQTVNDTCDSYNVLKMCHDIANASKHFGLNKYNEEKKITYSVFLSTSSMIDFYENLETGAINRVKRDNLDIVIMSEVGEIIGLWEFTDKVEKAWKEMFIKCGIVTHNN